MATILMVALPLVVGVILGVFISKKFSGTANEGNKKSRNSKASPVSSKDHVGKQSYLDQKSLKEMGEEEFERFLKSLGEKDVTPIEIENLYDVYQEIVPKIDSRIKQIQEMIEETRKIPEDSEPPERLVQHIQESYGVQVSTRDDILEVLQDLKEADDRKWGLLKSFLKKVDYSGHDFVDDQEDYEQSEIRKQLKYRD